MQKTLVSLCVACISVHLSANHDASRITNVVYYSNQSPLLIAVSYTMELPLTPRKQLSRDQRLQIQTLYNVGFKYQQ